MITDSTIYLRAPEPSDLQAMYAVENERTLWQHSAERAPMSMYRLRQYVEHYDTNILATDSGRFTICRHCDDVVVGFIDYFELDALNRRCGIGLVILEPYRRQGYGVAGIRLLSRYIGHELGMHSLWAVVAIDNRASQATFEAAGFTTSGRLRSWLRAGTTYTDALLYQQIL